MYKQQFLTTGRLTTAYYRAGEGNSRKLLLVHGNVSSSVFYLPLFPALAERFDVVAPDLRCFGDSEALAVDATRGFGDWTDDLAEFTAALGWERFAVAGWSMGGCIAMQYAMEHGGQLTGLILINPGSPCGFGGTKGADGVMLDPPGLASGGGQQMPIFAALGANCTVLDNSPRQIESELMVARREGYQIQAIRGDMTKPLPFADASFDLIFHPVSNCYIEDVMHVWRECHRILKPGGLLMAGLDNGVNFLFDEDENEGEVRYSLPFNPLKDQRLMALLEKNDDGVQFSHTLEEQIRGQIKAGFQLVDLYEDTNGEGFLHEHGVPTFWATLARK